MSELTPPSYKDDNQNDNIVSDLNKAQLDDTAIVSNNKPVSKFIQEAEYSVETKWDSTSEIIDLPSASREDSIKSVSDAPNVSLTDSPDKRKWAEVFSEGLSQAAYGETHSDTMSKETSEFHQGVESSVGVLMGTNPKFKPVENETLSGERGVLRVMSFLGIGTLFQVPLWHTGIWVTLRAPSEGDLLELQRQMIADKIELGRKSYGLSFSNTASYVTDRLVSFALSHLYETTLKDVGDLKTIISSHDIPALLWGMACAIYPRGFQYRRACVTDPDKCNHVIQERLNLSKILWTNTRALTDTQVNHMTKRRTNSMNMESVTKYQEELINCQKRQIIVNEGSDKEIKMTLRIPKVSEYVDSGNRWIGDIVSMVNKALGLEADENDRNQYILKHGQSSSMRQYLHWVDSVEFTSNIIDDRETLESVFSMLSSDDIMRNDFMVKIASYIDDTAITIVGIPVFDCPKCGSEQKSPLPKQTSIIPIDVYQTFFTLLVQKLQRLTVR